MNAGRQTDSGAPAHGLCLCCLASSTALYAPIRTVRRAGPQAPLPGPPESESAFPRDARMIPLHAHYSWRRRTLRLHADNLRGGAANPEVEIAAWEAGAV